MITAEPATITERPDEEMKAAEGKDILLKCAVFGSPTPLVVWKKGSEQLTGGRYKVTDEGHLQIKVGEGNLTLFRFFLHFITSNLTEKCLRTLSPISKCRCGNVNSQQNFIFLSFTGCFVGGCWDVHVHGRKYAR